MTPVEAALLLAKASAYDNRVVSEVAAIAWAEALPDVRVEDAAAVVIAHYASSRVWLMPADIHNGVKKLRATRIRSALQGAEPMPPGELADNPAHYQAWRKALIAALGDGTNLHDAETAACTAADIPETHRTLDAPTPRPRPTLETP